MRVIEKSDREIERTQERVNLEIKERHEKETYLSVTPLALFLSLLLPVTYYCLLSSQVSIMFCLCRKKVRKKRDKQDI
jgi:hypothetical protein